MNEERKGSAEPPGDERRRHPRKRVKLPIAFSAEGATLSEGMVINLSKRGLFLITEVGDIKMGDVVNVELQLGEGEPGEGARLIEAQARVVRVEDLSGLALFLSGDLQVEPPDDE